MAEKVAHLGIEKEEGYLYFIDKDGDISKTKTGKSRKKYSKTTKVAKVGIEKENGYLYFLDKDGDISRVTKESSDDDNPKKDEKLTLKNKDISDTMKDLIIQLSVVFLGISIILFVFNILFILVNYIFTINFLASVIKYTWLIIKCFLLLGILDFYFNLSYFCLEAVIADDDTEKLTSFGVVFTVLLSIPVMLFLSNLFLILLNYIFSISYLPIMINYVWSFMKCFFALSAIILIYAIAFNKKLVKTRRDIKKVFAKKFSCFNREYRDKKKKFNENSEDYAEKTDTGLVENMLTFGSKKEFKIAKYKFDIDVYNYNLEKNIYDKKFEYVKNLIDKCNKIKKESLSAIKKLKKINEQLSKLDVEEIKILLKDSYYLGNEKSINNNLIKSNIEFEKGIAKNLNDTVNSEIKNISNTLLSSLTNINADNGFDYNYEKIKEEVLPSAFFSGIKIAGSAISTMFSTLEIKEQIVEIKKRTYEISKSIREIKKNTLLLENTGYRCCEIIEFLDKNMEAFDICYYDLYNKLFNTISKSERKKRKENGGTYFSKEEIIEFNKLLQIAGSLAKTAKNSNI